MSQPQTSFFAFRHEPLKTIFMLFAVLGLVFVRIPYWVISSLLPSWRPRSSWSLSRTLRVYFLRAILGMAFRSAVPDMLGAADLEKLARSADETGFVWIDADPSIVVGEIKQAAEVNNVGIDRVGGVWYGQRGSDGRAGQPAAPNERVIYELHGGGWVMGNATRSWDSAYMCDEMLKYAGGYTRALQIEYRLSQSTPLPATGGFPAALVDAIMGYNYLVNTLGFKPSNILITGESSGGTLAFALTRYLVDSKLPSLPPPLAQLLLSPSADWGNSHVGLNSSIMKNDKSDYVQWFFAGYGTQSLLGNMPPEDMYTNSWISPGGARLPHVEGRFAGIPPTLIMAGDAERSLDGMKVLRDRLVADNGSDMVKYVELPDTTHVVMTHAWHEPERTQAYEIFSRWVDEIHAQK